METNNSKNTNQEIQILTDIPLPDYQISEIKYHHSHSLSTIIPSSITSNPSHGPPMHSHTVQFELNKKTELHSQRLANPNVNKNHNNVEFVEFDSSGRSNMLRDNRYDSFKTWSGKLDKHISNLRGKPREMEEIIATNAPEPTHVPKVHRFFDALKGPELETLKDLDEQLLLSTDKKWPFLLRFPITIFGICLGLSTQAILYKKLSMSAPTLFLHMPLQVNLILWIISISLLAILSLIYIFKIIFYFEAVRREFHHPVRVNFFFAPWIACLFLAIGVPPSILKSPPQQLWYVLMTPIACLEIKIYGQWMSGGQRRLSKVANPTNHLAIVGNFVGALLGASIGLKEGPIFFYAIGVAHYIVLFVTLYQRLPTNETLPRSLHPVFFLFIAAPCVASMAWASISGEFGYMSKFAYFIAIFLYASLVVRINLFRGFKFSLAWWAYTYPMTSAAVATIRYSIEVNNLLIKTLSVVLTILSTLTVIALLHLTMYHAWILHDLFPNDISIAIHHEPAEKIKDEANRVDLDSGNSLDKEGSY